MASVSDASCGGLLRDAHEYVSDIARDPDDWQAAVERLLEALDCFPNSDDALDGLEALVDERREAWLDEAMAVGEEHRAESDAAYRVRWYCAVVEDLYTSIGAPILAWEARQSAGLVALDLGRPVEAEELLREAAEALSDHVEIYAGAPWHLLAQALAEQKRIQEAATLFARAAAVSAAQGEYALAAGSLDARASRLSDEDPEQAFESYTEAADHWQLAGDESEARASRAAAGWTALTLSRQAYNRDDAVGSEAYAKLALAVGQDVADEGLAAMSALQVALFAVSGHADPATAVDLLEPYVGVLDRLADRKFEVYLLTILASAHIMLTNLSAAERLLRRALALADSVDEEVTAMVAEMLATFASVRFDQDGAQQLMRVVGQRLGRSDADDSALSAVLAAHAVGDYQRAQELAQRLVDGSPDQDPTGEVASALLYLLMLDAVLGDDAIAGTHLRQIENLITADPASLPGYVELSEESVLPYARALAVAASGDYATFERLLTERYDRCLALGLGETAARTASMLGTFALKAGRPLDALRQLIPASIGLSSLLSSLPSSAERKSLRDAMGQADLAILHLVAKSGGATLMAEYLELARAQGIPEVVESETDEVRSIATLVNVTTGTPVAAADWTRQETLLPHPPLVRMPWGTIACARYVEQAEPYARSSGRSGPTTVVELIVPR
jgi:hypothetical protein